MKKTLLTLAIVAMAYGSFAQAQNNAVKVNPLGLLFGFVNVSYEKAFSEKNSGQLGVGIIFADFGGTSLSGFGLAPEYRFYSKEALDKFYFAPLINYSSFTAEEDINKAKASSFGAGVKIGWNWLLGSEDNFVIDLGLGAQYLSTSVDVESGSEDALDFGSFDGVAPILNFSIGYAF